MAQPREPTMHLSPVNFQTAGHFTGDALPASHSPTLSRRFIATTCTRKEKDPTDREAAQSIKVNSHIKSRGKTPRPVQRWLDRPLSSDDDTTACTS